MDAPSWVLNGVTMRMFNEIYYRKAKAGACEQIIDWDSYFYPLDSILDWNRLYGRQGIAEYQCVLPKRNSRAGLTALLEEVSEARQGSFLAVLKLFGSHQTLFSFPMEGYTLALDFPATPRVLRLLDRLDRITLKFGGRLYLAKDARVSKHTFEASDERVDRFRQIRESFCLRKYFASAQSERLDI
jgi:hypothetical protein